MTNCNRAGKSYHLTCISSTSFCWRISWNMRISNMLMIIVCFPLHRCRKQGCFRCWNIPSVYCHSIGSWFFSIQMFSEYLYNTPNSEQLPTPLLWPKVRQPLYHMHHVDIYESLEFTCNNISKVECYVCVLCYLWSWQQLVICSSNSSIPLLNFERPNSWWLFGYWWWN